MNFADTYWVELIELHYLKGEVPFRVVKKMRSEVMSHLRKRLVETLGYLPNNWESRVSESHNKVFNGTRYFAEYTFTEDEKMTIGLLDNSKFNNP